MVSSWDPVGGGAWVEFSFSEQTPHTNEEVDTSQRALGISY